LPRDTARTLAADRLRARLEAHHSQRPDKEPAP
jgi:hypothetical protein